jgi:tetratricopeptide (TPR) repeat protein
MREEAERARAIEAELRRQAEAREKITQAAVLVNQGKFDDADKLVEDITFVPTSLESAAVFRTIGEQSALQNKWKTAADRYTTLIRIDQPNGWDVASVDYLACGNSLLQSGDMDRYEHFRQETITRFTDTENPVAAERVMKINLLIPADEKLMSKLQPFALLARRSFAREPPEAGKEASIFQAAWGAVSLALMEYRQGNFIQSMEWCRRCLGYTEFNAPRIATAHIVLAMASYQLGQTDKARSELAQGREMIQGKFKSGLDAGTGPVGFWFDWVFARTLMREATLLIDGKDNSPNGQ